MFFDNVDYNQYGATTKIEYGNGVVTTYAYDPLSLRLTNLRTTNSEPQTLQDLSYTYDAVGNILTITNAARGSNQAFTYDELNRLTSATGKYCSEGTEECTKNYRYDEIGNILEKDGLTYYYESSRPHAVTRIKNDTEDVMTFGYDGNGNMVWMWKDYVLTDYAYDTENRLIEVRKENEPIARYVYDGDGGRVKKIVFKEKSLQAKGAGVKFNFDRWLIEKERSLTQADSPDADAIRDTEITPPDSSEGWKPGSPSRGKEEHPNAEITKYVGSLYEVRGTRQTRFIYLGSTRIAAVDSSGKTTYYHGNHLGSTNVTTDADGNLDELFENEPFGVITTHEKYGSDEDTAKWYFTGKEFDTETGLVYFGARYYRSSGDAYEIKTIYGVRFTGSRLNLTTC